MNKRTKRIFILSTVVFIAAVIAVIVYTLVPKSPSTQAAEKTVIIKNYTKYTRHISADSFGYLGNFLYQFIKDPDQKVYYANIVDDSYTYSSDSWFSKFVIKVDNTDISWDISLQTVKGGGINGDIGVFCKTGGDKCLSILSGITNTKSTLQSQLPITDNEYIISNQLRTKNSISIVYYDQAGAGKEKAIKKIESLGFKPEDYDIQYFYGGR